MADSFTAAIIEFAATTAALNARALARAGLLDELELGTPDALLALAEGHAEAGGIEEQRSLIRALKECLPGNAS